MIKNFTRENPFKPMNDETVPDVVQLNNVSQKYGNNTIFENINFLIEKNNDVGIIKVIDGDGGVTSTVVKLAVASALKGTPLLGLAVFSRSHVPPLV
jgi:ATPase subunit of ABC transporter with duplicated ATPase domains